jgi:hypothetical protein
MGHYNEATAEIVERSEDRQNKVDIQKVISDRDLCQDGYSSSDKLTILKDNLEKDRDVKLNYIGSKTDLQNYGKPINDSVLSLPCLTKVNALGLVVPKSGDVVAEKTTIYETNALVRFNIEDDYTIVAQTISVKGDGRSNIFGYRATNILYVENGGLYFINSSIKIADIPKNKRVLISAVIARGSWYDGYYRRREMTYFVVMLGNKIVHYRGDLDYRVDEMRITTHSNENCETFTASYRTVRPNDNVPGELTQPKSWNPSWNNNVSTYQAILDRAGDIFSIVNDILEEEKGACK